MSKITREQIRKLMLRGKTSIDNDATDIMTLIDQREAEFQELVDAAVAFYEWRQGAGCPDRANKETLAIMNAAKPFLPPTDPHKELADKLKEFAEWPPGTDETSFVQRKELREIAAEIEKLGGEK